MELNEKKITRRFVKVPLRFIMGCLVIACMQMIGCATTSIEKKAEPATEESLAALEDRWGIEVIGISRTAAEYMLNFRYRVTDSDKALTLFDRKTKPYMIDQASGATLMVPSPPKVGPLRQTARNTKPAEGKTYFIFFANPGKSIKAGDKVTVVVGDFRAENLTVR